MMISGLIGSFSLDCPLESPGGLKRPRSVVTNLSDLMDHRLATAALDDYNVKLKPNITVSRPQGYDFGFCPVRFRMCSRILGLYPLAACSIPPVVTNRKCIQTLPDVPWWTELTLVDSHCLQLIRIYP